MTWSLPALASPECELALSRDAVAALRQAARSDYKVEILTATICGRPKVVVLLGEFHAKSKAEADDGRQVLAHFDRFATEGRDFSKTWGGQAWASLETLFRAARLPRPPIDRLLNLFSRLTPEFISEGSTIAEAERRATHAPIPLERGHAPDWRENVHSIWKPVFWGTVAAYLTLKGLGAETYATATLKGIELFGWHSFFGFMIERHAEPWDKAWFQRLFPLQAALVAGRDETMARHLFAAMQDDGVTSLLVIVGQAHLPGLKRRLLEQGFVSRALPAR